MSSDKATLSAFLRLPTELRLQIYDGVLHEDDDGRDVDVDVEEFIGYDCNTFAVVEEPLLQVNKQIYYEAMSQWMRIHRFMIDSRRTLEWFNGWLNNLDSTCLIPIPAPVVTSHVD